VIPISGLDHVVLRVRDLTAALDFYRGVLGLEIERELPPEVGLVQLRAGRALIDLVPMDGAIGRMGGAPPSEDGRNMDHFCLQLESFDEDAIRSHLERHGVDAGPTETRYGALGNGPSIYIRDPEGNTVELKGPPGLD
jgi:glyoxylase I family protein